MIFDAQQQVNGSIVQSDVCIVGAGAAGITIARELTASGASVCLFESGDLTADRATQALNRGDNGNPYDFPLDESRSRFFGGTTNQWSGWCRPLDPADFERREWIPGSGWPFGIETLLSFYDRARSLCELVARPDVEAARRTLSLDESRIVTRLFELSPPTRFGQVYRDDLASAQNVRTYLNANAISFRTDDAGQRIEAIEFRTLSGKSITVSASVFILATGGIENARLLLSSGLNRRHAI